MAKKVTRRSTPTSPPADAPLAGADAANASSVVPPASLTADAAPKAAAKKVVKPRATSVPPAAKTSAMLQDEPAAAKRAITHDMIATRAYHKWANGEAGDHHSHWHDAERELRDL